MRGRRIAAPSVGERGCRCWRRATKSELACRRPVWAGWRWNLTHDRHMSCKQVDTACTRFVVQCVTNATREGRKLHGHVVSGRVYESCCLVQGSLQRWQCCRWKNQRAQRYSNLVVTAQGPRPVVQRYHGRVVDELGVYGADEKNRSKRQMRRVDALRAQSRSTRRDRERRSLAGQRCC